MSYKAKRPIQRLTFYPCLTGPFNAPPGLARAHLCAPFHGPPGHIQVYHNQEVMSSGAF